MGLENPLHILIILVVILLVFGAKRLPELGRSLGTGMREFKTSITGADETPQEPTPHDLPAATVARTVDREPARPGETP